MKMLPPILGTYFTLPDYPESLQTEAIEKAIAASLPEIDGLEETGFSDNSRMKVFTKVAASQRRAFAQLHGDPFAGEVIQIDNAIVIREVQLVTA